MTQLDNPRFTLYMEQEKLFRRALEEYDPNTWFPRLPGKPTTEQPGNWFICFVPPSWGRWSKGGYGVHFDFVYGPKRGRRPERMRLPIGVESPMKDEFRRRFKQSVIDAVERAGIAQQGFALKTETPGKLLELDDRSIPFNNESWRVAMEQYRVLQPVIGVVSAVLREYQTLQAFEVPIDFTLRS